MPTSPSAQTQETGLPDSQALLPEITSDVPFTEQNVHPFPFPFLPRRLRARAATWKRATRARVAVYSSRPCIGRIACQHWLNMDQLLPGCGWLHLQEDISMQFAWAQEHRAWDGFWGLVANAGSYALLSSSVVAAALSFACVAVILLLYSARVFTPADAHVVRPLYFDFTQPQAEATVNLISAEPYTHYIHDLHELRAKVSLWTLPQYQPGPGGRRQSSSAAHA